MAQRIQRKNAVAVPLLCFMLVLVCLPLTSQSSPPSYFQLANYRTAQRCLEMARDAVIGLDYKQAYDCVITGLSYDDSIPDLWYLKALLLSVNTESFYEVKKDAETALQKTQWLYYTKEAARLLLSQMYVKTHEAQKALDVLNAKPLLITSDAEYVRAEAYYKLDQRQKAREAVSNARRSYPEDSRFPLLFFTYERFTSGGSDAYYNDLLQKLLDMVPTWKDDERDILLFASYFLSGEQKERYLKEYRISEKKNPLYIAAFLENGLLSEQEAVDALFSFASDTIDGAVFFEVLSLLKSDEALLSAAQNLESFSGTLEFDKTGDGEFDFYVSYAYGRPSFVAYDENTDGLLNWTSELDYGVPVKITCNDAHYELYYSRYPFVSSAVNTDTAMEINLIDGSVDWMPFSMEQIPLVNNLVFYLPSLEKPVDFIPLPLLLQNASGIVVYGGKDSDIQIRFSLYESLPKTAVYTKDGKPFAYGFFENGQLLFRNVDNDRNGSYELSEMYDFNPEAGRLYLNETQSKAMYKELFGSLEANEGLYVTKIIADTNENSLTDFMEEYRADGSKMTAWDSDEDGNWDLFYEKSVSKEAGLEEKISFYHFNNKDLVVIRFVNKEPLELVIGNQKTLITKQEGLPFYWIGSVPDSSYAAASYAALQESGCQGLRLLIKPDAAKDAYVLAIKIDDFYFGEFINE